MPSPMVFALWGLLLLAVPLAAAPGDWSRRDGSFAMMCVPVTVLLVMFVPKPPILAPAAAIAGTALATAIVVLAYLALTPRARPGAARLAIVMAIVAAAGLAAVHLAARLALHDLLAKAVVLAAAGTPLLILRRR